MNYFFGIFDSIIRNNIIQSGLVMDLNAANTTSYPGTGNIWYDLTTSNFNATLVGSPTFINTNGGNLFFNGINQYTTSSIVSNYTNATISLWIKPTGGNQSITTWTDASGSVNTYTHVLNITNTRYLDAYLYIPGGSPPQTYVHGITQLSLLNWYNVVMSWQSGSGNTGNLTSYVNGINQGSSAISTPILNLPTFQMAIQTGIGQNFNGSIARSSIYNRQLSQAEIIINYNALCQRYGQSPI
jgi:hypothetical protein